MFATMLPRNQLWMPQNGEFVFKLFPVDVVAGNSARSGTLNI